MRREWSGKSRVKECCNHQSIRMCIFFIYFLCLLEQEEDEDEHASEGWKADGTDRTHGTEGRKTGPVLFVSPHGCGSRFVFAAGRVVCPRAGTTPAALYAFCCPGDPTLTTAALFTTRCCQRVPC
jgi:hypothetical protein